MTSRKRKERADVSSGEVGRVPTMFCTHRVWREWPDLPGRLSGLPRCGSWAVSGSAPVGPPSWAWRRVREGQTRLDRALEKAGTGWTRRVHDRLQHYKGGRSRPGLRVGFPLTGSRHGG